MVTLDKLLQPLNVLKSIFCIPFGIVILFKLVHSKNALCPILVMLFGNVTLTKPSQPQNA